MSRPGTMSRATAAGTTTSFKAADFSSPWRRAGGGDDMDAKSSHEQSQAPVTPNNESPSRGDNDDQGAVQARVNAYFGSQEQIAEADVGEEQDGTHERSAMIPRTPIMMKSSSSSKALRQS